MLLTDQKAQAANSEQTELRFRFWQLLWNLNTKFRDRIKRTNEMDREGENNQIYEKNNNEIIKQNCERFTHTRRVHSATHKIISSPLFFFVDRFLLSLSVTAFTFSWIAELWMLKFGAEKEWEQTEQQHKHTHIQISFRVSLLLQQANELK